MVYKHAPDKTRARAFVYKENHEPEIVYLENVQEWYDKGWCSSPADFFKVSDVGVDKEDVVAVQIVGENIEKVKNYVNGAINLHNMKAKELEKFALENFEIDLDRRIGKKKMIKKIEKLMEKG